MALSRTELTARLVTGLEQSACAVTLENDPAERPVLLRVDAGLTAIDLRVFVWNATPGGPAGVRREGEYRVQTTRPGDVPFMISGPRRTLLLGFHEGLEVFAAWDVRVHENPGSSSSLQVALSTLEEARTEGFASQIRTVAGGTEEAVFAFRPELAATYLDVLPAILAAPSRTSEAEALSKAGSGEEPAVDELPADAERQVAIREIAVRVRDARFRTRVIAAYGSRCAFCGLGAGLVDAAHIVGVAADGPDLVVNGIAACPTHHRAFDRGLVLVADDLSIEVNSSRLTALDVAGEEVDALEDGMYANLLAPDDAALRPAPHFLAAHRLRFEQ